MTHPGMAAFFSNDSAARAAHLNSLFERVADRLENVSMFDFAAELCPDEATANTRDGCLLAADGEPARFDGLHYTSAGGELAAELLTDMLLGSVVDAP